VSATLYSLRLSHPALAEIAALGDLAPYVEDHPAVRWAATVVPPLPGPVPAVQPREWLRPLDAALTA
jgi:hypothetical protein